MFALALDGIKLTIVVKHKCSAAINARKSIGDQRILHEGVAKDLKSICQSSIVGVVLIVDMLVYIGPHNAASLAATATVSRNVI